MMFRLTAFLIALLHLAQPTTTTAAPAFIHNTPQPHQHFLWEIRAGGTENDTTEGAVSISAAPLPVPPLRYLGDAQLMQQQPAVDMENSSSLLLAEQLDMLQRAMEQYGGIGIAAPQVGWWTRVFCFGIKDGNNRYPSAGSIPFSIWINPEITWSSENTNWMWEGCLSVPGMRGWVERPSEVVLQGWNEHGERQEERLAGLAARIAQHEFDHVDGILFPMRVPSAKFLVSQAIMEARDGWADDWPSLGSRKTLLGELSNEK